MFRGRIRNRELLERIVSADDAARLIKDGWVQVLFAGNALATHDMEQALFGTSLGVSLTHGEPIEHGHEHHIRAINTIRRLGGISGAVERGTLNSGIMYEATKAGIDVVSACRQPRRECTIVREPVSQTSGSRSAVSRRVKRLIRRDDT